jgi:hypothetical protein
MLRRVQRFGPLLVLVAAEFVSCAYLALTHAIPAGHDGFQYFYLKYYVFNDVVENGELPHWLPYVTHGAPATWWSVLQSGIFDPVMLGAARLLHLHDFFPIFYTLLFAEKMLLVGGTWLLASQDLQSRPAIFAVTAAVAGTAVWYTQPWWNFHAIVGLPMMLFFLHRTLFTFRWKWPIALSLLLYLQTFGQPVYYLPMTLLFIAMYGVVVLAYHDPAAGRAPRFRFSAAGALMFVLVNAAFLTELLWLRRWGGEMASGSNERAADGGVQLTTFLNYAGYTDLRTWNQFFTSLTPHLDFTVFAGFLIAGLTVLTFCAGPLNRPQRVFAWLTGLVVLVATASPFATLIYYYWPLARIFRHLALIAPVAKFFCILLAGATFDRLLADTDRLRVSRRSILGPILALGPWLVLLAGFGFNHAGLRSYLAAMTSESLAVLDSYSLTKVSERLWRAVGFLGLTLGVFVAFLRQARRGGSIARLGWIAAGILFLDVSTYGAREMRTRTITLRTDEAALFHFAPLPYADRRFETPDDRGNVRRAAFASVMSRVVGARYWSENLLWFADTYRGGWSVYWSAALDSLLKTVSQEGLPAPESTLLPAAKGALPIVAAERAPKVRLLSRAIVCPDVPSTARVFLEPAYRGQVALLTENPSRRGMASSALSGVPTSPCDPSAVAVADDQPAPTGAVRIAAFTSNRAEFDVENQTAVPLLMTYSDSWNEHWEARVNGQVAEVIRSDLAYKTVVVPPGKARVVFDYRDRLAELAFAEQGAASLAFVVVLIAPAFRRRLISAPRPAMPRTP